MPIQAIAVHWIDEARVIAAATANGWTEGESLADFVNDVNDYDGTKAGFSSVTKAKAWAARNRQRDLWRQPEIAVYEWPSLPKRSWERETVRSLRYEGDGYGWTEQDTD